MTEWNPGLYREHSTLQQAMAAEVLEALDVNGSEWVLDVGSGDGRITSETAGRVPLGSVVGVDVSTNMIERASKKAGPNLRFEVADARHLPYHHEFDLVVSFNALHWVQEQGLALTSIHKALKPGGVAHLRLVPMGARKSIETVLEETRNAPAWKEYFHHFRDPYLRLTPDAYYALAQENGFGLNACKRNQKLGTSEAERRSLTSVR